MKYPKISDKEIEIIKQAKQGDERAFNELFYKYKSFVDELLFSYVKDMDEAYDLTNIVFIKVHDKLKLFTEYNTFGGWLKTLSKNIAIDYLRLRKKKDNINKDIESLSNESYNSTNDDPINHLLVKEILEYLRINFPKNYDKVFEFVIEGMSYPQISDVLNMPINTIKSIMHRIRPNIKRNFNF